MSHLAELEHALADDRLGLVWVSVIACHLWCDHKGEEEESVARRSMNRTRAENVTEWSLVLSVGLEQLPTGGQEGRWAGDTKQSTLRTGSGCQVHEGGRRTGTKAEINILGYIRHAKSRSLTSSHWSTPLLLAKRQGTGWQYLGRLRSSPWPIVIRQPHSPNGKLSTDGLRQEEGCRLEDTAPGAETRGRDFGEWRNEPTNI